jgi:phosphocarrier protein HPr
MSVAEATVEVKNKLGLHLRAASTLAQALAKFKSSITLARGKELSNAKSVTALMMLGAGLGTKLKVKADGDDARDALATLQRLFEDRFGEE